MYLMNSCFSFLLIIFPPMASCFSQIQLLNGQLKKHVLEVLSFSTLAGVIMTLVPFFEKQLALFICMIWFCWVGFGVHFLQFLTSVNVEPFYFLFSCRILSKYATVKDFWYFNCHHSSYLQQYIMHVLWETQKVHTRRLYNIVHLPA